MEKSPSNLLKKSKLLIKVNRQPVKLVTSLKKISNLNLSAEKKELFCAKSKFSSLLSITNDKESSATLIEALSLLYNSDSNNFLLNENVFCFCPREVANVLGISMGDLDFNVFDSKITKSSQFPDSVFNLRRDVVRNVELKEPLTTPDLKGLIEGMEVGEEKHKQLFVQLLNYYYIEQFALCGTKLNKPRITSWKFVSDLDEFDKVDWATAIHQHLMRSIVDVHEFTAKGRLGQNTFRGCVPVLEAILFERMPTLYSGSKRSASPPVQHYNFQRQTVDVWTTKLLGCEINPCPHCSLVTPNSPSEPIICTSLSITLPPSQVCTPRSLVTPHSPPRSLVTPHTPRQAQVTPHSPPRSPVPHSPFEPINEGFSPPGSSMLDQVIQDVENMLVSPSPKVQEDRTRAGKEKGKEKVPDEEKEPEPVRETSKPAKASERPRRDPKPAKASERPRREPKPVKKYADEMSGVKKNRRSKKGGKKE